MIDIPTIFPTYRIAVAPRLDFRIHDENEVFPVDVHALEFYYDGETELMGEKVSMYRFAGLGA